MCLMSHRGGATASPVWYFQELLLVGVRPQTGGDRSGCGKFLTILEAGLDRVPGLLLPVVSVEAASVGGGK